MRKIEQPRLGDTPHILTNDIDPEGTPMTQSKNWLRTVATHEAGHAVVTWLSTGIQFGFRSTRWPGFHRVVIRTREEIEAGPILNRNQRPCSVAGMVEGSGSTREKVLLASYSDDLREGWGLLDRGSFLRTNPRSWHTFIRDAWLSALIGMAGPVAEFYGTRDFDKDDVWDAWDFYEELVDVNGAEGDHAALSKLLYAFCRNRDEMDDMHFLAFSQAWRLVTWPFCWSMVGRFAEVLEVERDMDSDRSMAVLRKCAPWPPAAGAAVKRMMSPPRSWLRWAKRLPIVPMRNSSLEDIGEFERCAQAPSGSSASTFSVPA